MERACEYDRAVGYFRSTAFIIAWPSLRGFVARNGKMRVLCSQVLSADDIQALEQGYAGRVDEAVAARLLEEVRSFLSEDEVHQPARILAALVANGTIELKIAVLHEADRNSASGRIFHDKLGVFRDEAGNRVIFKGSMNETWSGLASDGNLESIDVAASWMGARDLERTEREETYFDSLWQDRYPSLTVRPFPEVARAELTSAADPNWEASLERLVKDDAEKAATLDARGRTLRPHQAAGLASWKANDRRGILAFVTGAGKTFTAITAIREALTEYQEVVVILVPDKVLFEQWKEEIKETTADIDAKVLLVGAGHTRWRDHLGLWTSPGEQPRIVLATVQTARTDDFRRRVSGGSHVMLVADEVHRLGSAANRSLLDEKLFGPRLGLSATPERAGDHEGTQAVLGYFDGVLDPRYSLADAVRDRVLTPYFYHPQVVRLSPEEANEWIALSAEISKLQARISDGDTSHGIESRLERLYFARARIVKHAEAKVPLALRVLSENYSRGQRWIVYCEDLAQLETVCRELTRSGIRPIPFHSQMEGNRGETLKWLDQVGGVVVAIKCLDEGVDIPSVTHALILASSKNPREFIQRRGRVLRRAPRKGLAHIYDAIVTAPKESMAAFSGDDPIISAELARAVEFAQHAENPAAGTDLMTIAIEAGLEWRNLLDHGVEDEEE
jgi:superfamily II DNA or RNA helicase